MKPLSDQIEIRRYADSLKQTWDRFVPTTKNRSFLFLRDYMDYHRERFSDHSLLFLVNRRLLACLPAHVADGKLCSHLGLTFGGLLLHRDIRLRQVQGIVRALCGHLRTHGLTAALYRRRASPFDRALDVHISKLRKKLGRRGASIRTVRGVGYLFRADPDGAGGS